MSLDLNINDFRKVNFWPQKVSASLPGAIFRPLLNWSSHHPSPTGAIISTVPRVYCSACSIFVGFFNASQKL